ncbi:hypothetical protein ACIB24_06465 [Spongisporangium articulatum]|uniref:Uncharacterized protein n=1 Tax=Spongisporangium articulatum TaxID=3362603 RepID=A0ABW8AL26_9ACTN
MRGIRAVATTTLLAASLLAAPPSSRAATRPETASVKPLATVQVNGVVWSQVVVGGTVYATGSFTRARPAGAAPGTSETTRSNLLAYSISTGKLVTAWKPRLNAQGRAIAASTDGKRIYVGGDFTEANGATHNRIVALSAKTGGVVTSFKGSLNGGVNALAVGKSTVYVGGLFSTARGEARARLAAFSTASGAVRAWKPRADAQVYALALIPSKGTVVIGGKFATLNGTTQPGLGAVRDDGSGTSRAWPTNRVVRNSGRQAAIGSLVATSKSVYATGWTYDSGGNFESVARMDLDGKLLWVSGCRGDTYGAYSSGGVVYTVGHAHDCTSVPGGFSQPTTTPRYYHRGVAFTASTAGTNGFSSLDNTFFGRPAPRMLPKWLPDFAAGSYTGQNQGPWTVTGNGKYLVVGGEFPSVGGKPQQGLVRFALP